MISNVTIRDKKLQSIKRLALQSNHYDIFIVQILVRLME